MDPSKLTPKETLSLFSHELAGLEYAMLKVKGEPVTRRPLEDLSHSSSRSYNALLDGLPTELWQCIANLLDFRSLGNFSCASRRAKAAVEALPAYRDLLRHAPEALVVLSRTGLISHHSAAKIHSALRAQRCSYCPDFAPFLVVTTCERCCHNCLYQNRSLQVVSAERVQDALNVSAADLNRVPLVFLSEKLHSFSHVKSPSFSQVVCVKQLKESGVADHASEQTMCSLREHTYFAKGAVKFPSLGPDGGVERGLWCIGCLLKSDFQFRGMLADLDPHSMLRAEDQDRDYEKFKYQARTKPDFLEHVRTCERVNILLQTDKSRSGSSG